MILKTGDASLTLAANLERASPLNELFLSITLDTHGLFAAGWTREQLFDGYPHLSEDGLRAVFAYAAEAVAGRQANTRDLKRDAHALIDSLLPNADWEDLMYAVYVRQAVEAGERDIDAGRTLSESEVRARLREP